MVRERVPFNKNVTMDHGLHGLGPKLSSNDTFDSKRREPPLTTPTIYSGTKISCGILGNDVRFRFRFREKKI